MYVRYPLSLRTIEDLLFERGIDVSFETVRQWWNRFGPVFAAEIRRQRAAHHRTSVQWRWHLGEMFVRINSEVFVTKHRDRKAAKGFLRRAMKRYGRPRRIVTERLRSYGAATGEIGNAHGPACGRWRNNRAENAHQPMRRRERAMIRIQTPGTLQKFGAAAYGRTLRITSWVRIGTAVAGII